MVEQKAVQSYRDLIIWQRGMSLAKRVYELPAVFPGEEKYGLIAQLRRAAVSVPSNIAEGQARRSTAEFRQFLSHALGSLAEVDTQIRLGMLLGFCTEVQAEPVLSEIAELRAMIPLCETS